MSAAREAGGARLANGVCLTNEYDGTVRVRMKTLAAGWDEVTVGTLNRGDRANHRCVNGHTVRVQVKFDDRSANAERSITVGAERGGLGLRNVTVTSSGTLTQPC